jgi:hypothetical protein
MMVRQSPAHCFRQQLPHGVLLDLDEAVVRTANESRICQL